MIALNSFTSILFLICVHVLLVEPRKKHPRIQDVISFSLEREKADILAARVDFKNNRTSVHNQSIEDAIKKPDTRRVMVGPSKAEQYEKAMNYQFRTKICDCMLQLVYMVRHYFKVFERRRYVDKTSITFRIGYLCKELRMLFKKSVRIFELLNIRQKRGKWAPMQSVVAPLTLHHKVAKMNVDFDYFYEVLKRLHMKAKRYEAPRFKINVYQLGIADYDRFRP